MDRYKFLDKKEKSLPVNRVHKNDTVDSYLGKDEHRNCIHEYVRKILGCGENILFFKEYSSCVLVATLVKIQM